MSLLVAPSPIPHRSPHCHTGSRLILAALGLFFVPILPAHCAEPLLTYSLSQSLAPTISFTGLTASELQPGPGLAASALSLQGGRTVLKSSALTASDPIAALAQGQFLTIRVKASTKVEFTDLVLTADLEGSRVPNLFSVYSSQDQFAAPTATVRLTKAGAPSVVPIPFTLNASSELVLRLVFHGRNGADAGAQSKIILSSLLLRGPGGASLPPNAARWSDPATWGGRLPAQGQDLTIPAGRTVVLDTATVPLGVLTINGRLTVDPSRDVTLTAHHIVVDGGQFDIGTATAPYSRKAVITLTGSNPQEEILVHGMASGSKGLIVHGGTLELFGARAQAVSWTRLTAHTKPGDTSITVERQVDWRPGDEIVIAPSGFDPYEAEPVRVTSVSQRTVHFTPALRFDHWGTKQTIEGKVIDQRAEVGLLTRDIVIQGDTTSAQNKFGGHVMVMVGSKARVEGVEFFHMGQLRKRGRYPFHWHLVGDGSGQFIRNCSVHRSFHRAYVVHQINHTEVANNVAYDVHSHMYVFSEDGPEFDNTFRGNLGILCRSLKKEDWAFVNERGESFQGEKRGSVFWGRRPNQFFEYNHAVGADNGMGFFFDPARKSKIANATVSSFKGNVAHTIAGDFIPNITYPPGSRGNGLFVHDYSPDPPAEQIFGDFTAYKCTGFGMWTERHDQVARDAILADNGAGLLGFSGRCERILIVGQTANLIGGSPKPIGQIRKNPGVLGGANHGDAKRITLRDITFVNHRDPAILWEADFTAAGMSCAGIRLVNSPPLDFPDDFRADLADDHDPVPSFFLDLDGSLSGTGEPTALFQTGNPLVTKRSTWVPAWRAYRHRLVPGSPITLDNDNRLALPSGTWLTATRPAGYLGPNFLSDGASKAPEKFVRYTPPITGPAAWYLIQMYHPSSTTFSATVPVTIRSYPGIAHTVRVDQRSNGSVWRDIGAYFLDSGSSWPVSIANNGTTGIVVADALRWIPLRLE